MLIIESKREEDKMKDPIIEAIKKLKKANVKQIVEETSISYSTVYRRLSSLVKFGFIDRKIEKYYGNKKRYVYNLK